LEIKLFKDFWVQRSFFNLSLEIFLRFEFVLLLPNFAFALYDTKLVKFRIWVSTNRFQTRQKLTKGLEIQNLMLMSRLSQQELHEYVQNAEQLIYRYLRKLNLISPSRNISTNQRFSNQLQGSNTQNLEDKIEQEHSQNIHEIIKIIPWNWHKMKMNYYHRNIVKGDSTILFYCCIISVLGGQENFQFLIPWNWHKMKMNY